MSAFDTALVIGLVLGFCAAMALSVGLYLLTR